MTTPNEAPTQVKNASRSTFRTFVAVLVGVLTVIPTVLATSDLDQTVLGAQIILVTASITRLLAIPAVNDFIETYLPVFAAQSNYVGTHRAV